MTASVEGECGRKGEKDNLAEVKGVGSWEIFVDAVIPSAPGYGKPIIFIRCPIRCHKILIYFFEGDRPRTVACNRRIGSCIHLWIL